MAHLTRFRLGDIYPASVSNHDKVDEWWDTQRKKQVEIEQWNLSDVIQVESAASQILTPWTMSHEASQNIGDKVVSNHVDIVERVSYPDTLLLDSWKKYVDLVLWLGIEGLGWLWSPRVCDGKNSSSITEFLECD